MDIYGVTIGNIFIVDDLIYMFIVFVGNNELPYNHIILPVTSQYIVFIYHPLINIKETFIQDFI